MYDFYAVVSTTKDEQLRAWAIEKAVDSYTGTEVTPNSEAIILRAHLIEQFVRSGTTS